MRAELTVRAADEQLVGEAKMILRNSCHFRTRMHNCRRIRSRFKTMPVLQDTCRNMPPRKPTRQRPQTLGVDSFSLSITLVKLRLLVFMGCPATGLLIQTLVLSRLCLPFGPQEARA